MCVSSVFPVWYINSIHFSIINLPCTEFIEVIEPRHRHIVDMNINKQTLIHMCLCLYLELGGALVFVNE